MNISIRMAEKSDIVSLFLLENQTFKSNESPLNKRTFAYHIERNLLLVAHVENQLAAYILIIFPKGNNARLYSIAVDKQFRRLNIASQLLQTAIEKIQTVSQKQTLLLEVYDKNEAAIQFYKKYNFEIIRCLKDYYGEGNHGIKMEYKLKLV